MSAAEQQTVTIEMDDHHRTVVVILVDLRDNTKASVLTADYDTKPMRHYLVCLASTRYVETGVRAAMTVSVPLGDDGSPLVFLLSSDSSATERATAARRAYG